jgi:hypothetical protein
MADDRDDEENVIETEEGTAGGPRRHDPAGTRLRAETPGMLPPDQLDERQRRIRTDRKTGGPDLAKDGEAGEDEAAADVPPTETEEPPGPPPPPTP